MLQGNNLNAPGKQAGTLAFAAKAAFLSLIVLLFGIFA